eukprot:scaffold22664_cov125-Cylindrotheca_fusiformis.AAC.6
MMLIAGWTIIVEAARNRSWSVAAEGAFFLFVPLRVHVSKRSNDRHVRKVRCGTVGCPVDLRTDGMQLSHVLLQLNDFFHGHNDIQLRCD